MQLLRLVRTYRLQAAVGAVVIGGGLAAAPAALAASTWVWTGAGPSPDWSVATNWNGGVGFQAGQPAYPGPFFEDLSGCDNGSSSGPCYSSTDDVSVTLDKLGVDDSAPYMISAANSAQITLIGDAPGLGLVAEPGTEPPSGKTPEISVPIVIPTGSAQHWDIKADGTGGDQALEVDDITTQSALDVNFTNGATLYTKSLAGGQALGLSGVGKLVFGGAGGSVLDAGGTISLTNSATLAVSTSGSVSAGSIDLPDGTGGELTIGSNRAPDTVLDAGDVTFNSGIDFLQMSLDSACPSSTCTAGADNSQLVSTGTVNLAGTSLVLNQGSDSAGFCDDLVVGQTYELISAPTVSGTFANIPDGDAIPLAELCGLGAQATPSYVQIHYGSDAVTATVSAVGDAGAIPQDTGAAPAITDASTAGTSVVAGDTLAVSNGSWNESSSTASTTRLSYAYAWTRCTAAGACTQIGGQSGSSYTTSSDDVGDTIYATVTATNTLGAAQASSASVGAVLAVIAPTETAAPKISGGSTVGSVISVSSSGAWNARPSADLTYQWMLCSTRAASSCVATGAAGTTKTLRLARAELGRWVAVRVTATNRGGTALARSNLVGRVIPTHRAILEALVRLRHPANGGRTVGTLAREGVFKTRFASPSAGVLHILWRTRIGSGKGAAHHRRSIVLATATRTYSRLGAGPVTVRLTRYGRKLLERRPRRQLILSTDEFKPLGGRWTVHSARFKL